MATSGLRDAVAGRLHAFDGTPGILAGVAVGAFLETTVLPVPFELILVPLMLARPRLIWAIGAAALGGCLLGAAAGYLVGALVFGSFGQALLELLGAKDAYEGFAGRLETGGFWALFLVGFTPVPIQVATLAAGFAGYSPVGFALAMLVSRGARYLGLCLLVRWFGDSTLAFVRRHRRSALVAGLALTGLLVYLLI